MKPLDSLTLTSLLQRSEELYSDYEAVGYVDGEAVSYRTLAQRVRQTAAGLRSLGVTPGDRVAILSENTPNWSIAYLAVTTMGAVVVPILPDFSEIEVSNILDHCGASVVFVSKRLLPKLGSDSAGRSHGSGGGRSPAMIMLDDFSGLPQMEPGPGAAPDEDDLAAIIYTSGTTGNSKGVMLTHRNIASNVEAARPIAEMSPGEQMVSLLPLSHAYECTIGLLVPLSAGCCVWYLDKPPSPTVLMPALEKIRPHLMLTVPLFIEKIYRNRVLATLQKKAILRAAMRVAPLRVLLHRAAGKKVKAIFGGRLHFFGIGGAAVAPDVERFMRDAKFPYAVGYGLTETAPLLAGCGPRHTLFRSTGPALEGVELRVADPDPETGEGEIQARGANVMRGYYRDPDRTAETFTADGWFRTGDLGAIDAKGNVFIKGRLKNMILGPSGENIYPEELEAVINAEPLVQDSLVLQKGGQLVALVNLNIDAFKEYLGDVTSNVGDEIDRLRIEAEAFLNELQQRVNAQLSAFARISRFIPQLEPFEKTPTMKIKRYIYESRLSGS